MSRMLVFFIAKIRQSLFILDERFRSSLNIIMERCSSSDVHVLEG